MMISEAPLVYNRYPPLGRGITVPILFRTELKVYTRVNLSSVISSRIDWYFTPKPWTKPKRAQSVLLPTWIGKSPGLCPPFLLKTIKINYY